MARSSPTIDVSGLTKRYGDKTAVDGLSFTVEPGRVTGFLGPNGAGKSTTMRLVLGLERADAGHATIGGRRYVDLPRPLTAVGALLEAKAVHSGRSAYHHLLCLAQTQGLPNSRADEVLERVGLRDVARKRAGAFSLGMGQRLGIAAAMLGNPDVLLLDEPVNGLDPEGVLWIRNLVKQHAAEGGTVLISSHLLNEVAVTADHLVVIAAGRLVADCSTAAFVDDHSARSVLVRCTDIAALAPLLHRAGGTVVAEGPDGLDVTGLDARAIAEIALRERLLVHELTPRRATLEAAFLSLTGSDTEYRAVDPTAGAVAPSGGASTIPRAGAESADAYVTGRRTS